ncbi:MAG: sigma-70 family RNA polymerase sigma factor [Bacteroidota bacterium]|nr:sigma-70 family RNA polymerase sigma factor [Bacteroidota bacterium]
MLKDEDLVNECLKNNTKAQEQLYKRFASKMYGICLRFVRYRIEADDILQDGFVKVFENLKYFRADGSLEGWIKRIMVNTAINYYNKNTVQQDNETDIDSPGSMGQNELIDENIISHISRNELLEIINELADGYRMVFNLYVIDGYNHKEIGEIMNISENTSKSQLSRARKILQEKILKRSEILADYKTY